MRLRSKEKYSSGEFDRDPDNTTKAPSRDDGGFPCALSGRTYLPDASILLIGLRGTGKSTLALVASAALRYGLVDSGRIFQDKFGLTRAAYAARYGSNEYRRQEVELLRAILHEHPTGAIIVCGSAALEDPGQALVRAFSESHPVIFILRDASDISQYVGSCDEKAIATLADRSNPLFRGSSDFEFYNLSDSSIATSNRVQTTKPSLLLKSMERDFLQWCSLIRKTLPAFYADRAQHSLTSVPLEKRCFTYCLSVPMEQASVFAEDVRNRDILADAIELTVDIAPLCTGAGFDQAAATQITRQYFVVRRTFQLPIILHVILPIEDGSNVSASRQAYLGVVTHALRLAPDYLTIDFHLDDFDIRNIQSARGRTKIIGHYSEATSSRSDWFSPETTTVLQRMSNVCCDVMRLCKLATSRTDNQSIQDFMRSVRSSGQVDVPVVAYNTGRIGRPSYLLNQALTPVTHPLLSNQSQNSVSHMDGLLTIGELQKALFSSYALEPQIFGVFGANVHSSLSPTMHNSAFEAFGMPHKYLKFQSPSLSELKVLVQDNNFGGASITAPFKQEIISVIDYLSPSARAIGAVNTLIPLRSGGLEGLLARTETGPITALYGANTDYIGIFNCVRQNLSPVNAIRASTTALVLGAGGMAHACVYSMIRLGIQNIVVCNRTESRAQKLAERFSGKTYSLDHSNIDGLSLGNTSEVPVCGPADVRVISSTHDSWPTALEPPTVIVSCIPSAARNGPTNLTIPEQWFSNKTGGVLVELSYDALETPLMKQAQTFHNRGWIPVHGLQVLPEQGIAQWELFTGHRAPEFTMRSQITHRYRELAQ